MSTDTLFKIDASRWFNSEPVDIGDGQSQLYLIYVFQMLCAGCVYHGLPMINQIQQHLKDASVKVIGLHSVFENHQAMTDSCLEVFIREFYINYPVAVDRHVLGSPIPVTMAQYGFRGTPTYLILNRKAEILHHQFGATNSAELIQTIHLLLNQKQHS